MDFELPEELRILKPDCDASSTLNRSRSSARPLTANISSLTISNALRNGRKTSASGSSTCRKSTGPIVPRYPPCTEDEFEKMMPAYEELVAVLAEQGCDLIHPHGAPPFMVLGRKREAEIVKAWETKYKTPIMSVAQNHVNALKVLNAKTIIDATYFPPKLNAVFAEYFRDAGFIVRGMEGIDVPFNKVQGLGPADRTRAHEMIPARFRSSILRRFRSSWRWKRNFGLSRLRRPPAGNNPRPTPNVTRRCKTTASKTASGAIPQASCAAGSLLENAF